SLHVEVRREYLYAVVGNAEHGEHERFLVRQPRRPGSALSPAAGGRPEPARGAHTRLKKPPVPPPPCGKGSRPPSRRSPGQRAAGTTTQVAGRQQRRSTRDRPARRRPPRRSAERAPYPADERRARGPCETAEPHSPGRRGWVSRPTRQNRVRRWPSP